MVSRRVALAGFCLGLAACVSLPVAEVPPRTPRSLTAFVLNGRLSVQHGGTSYHTGIRWDHAAARDEIFISTPLGQGIAELVRNATGARLVTADRREVVAADWEALAAEVFGLRLPLDGLPRWLTGHVPDPATGWRMTVHEYADDAPDALPVRIEFSRGDTNVRVRIDEWSELQ
jgi:outer membrane lipoprotein LolB